MWVVDYQMYFEYPRSVSKDVMQISFTSRQMNAVSYVSQHPLNWLYRCLPHICIIQHCHGAVNVLTSLFFKCTQWPIVDLIIKYEDLKNMSFKRRLGVDFLTHLSQSATVSMPSLSASGTVTAAKYAKSPQRIRSASCALYPQVLRR